MFSKMFCCYNNISICQQNTDSKNKIVLCFGYCFLVNHNYPIVYKIFIFRTKKRKAEVLCGGRDFSKREGNSMKKKNWTNLQGKAFFSKSDLSSAAYSISVLTKI
jgi:hypothetical protein